jgi:hypothetical protein
MKDAQYTPVEFEVWSRSGGNPKWITIKACGFEYRMAIPLRSYCSVGGGVWVHTCRGADVHFRTPGSATVGF